MAHHSAAGVKGGRKRAETLDAVRRVEIARSGGVATASKFGASHMAEIGRKGALLRWRQKQGEGQPA